MSAHSDGRSITNNHATRFGPAGVGCARTQRGWVRTEPPIGTVVILSTRSAGGAPNCESWLVSALTEIGEVSRAPGRCARSGRRDLLICGAHAVIVMAPVLALRCPVASVGRSTTPHWRMLTATAWPGGCHERARGDGEPFPGRARGPGHECLDRVYLNAYVPILQSSGQGSLGPAADEEVLDSEAPTEYRNVQGHRHLRRLHEPPTWL
jgi:hypothetical protein